MAPIVLIIMYMGITIPLALSIKSYKTIILIPKVRSMIHKADNFLFNLFFFC